MVALAIVDVQGPRGLVIAEKGVLLCLPVAAEAGAGEADACPARGRDDAQLPVELAFARRQVRRTHDPEAPARARQLMCKPRRVGGWWVGGGSLA